MKILRKKFLKNLRNVNLMKNIKKIIYKLLLQKYKTMN